MSVSRVHMVQLPFQVEHLQVDMGVQVAGTLPGSTHWPLPQ